MAHHRSGDARLHINLRLERWHRRSLYAVLGLLFGSGLCWLGAHYLLRQPGPFGDTVHPLEPWSIRVHGAAAMLTLFLCGSLLNSHIRRALKSGRNRASGWAMLGVLLVLLVSAYGLYYLITDTSRPWWSLLHWALGLVFGPLLVLHIVLGRRARPAAARP